MLTRRLDLGVLELAVCEQGEGGRGVLLVHGFTGAKENLAPTVTLMAGRGWHAVAPDLRGHGASDAPGAEEDYDFGIMAGDLVAVADALGWGRFAVVGHSFGGALAQLVALESPHRLDALVLAGTFHGPVTAVDPDLVALGAAIVRDAGMEGLAQALAARRKADPSRQGAVEGLDSGQEAVREQQLLACSPAMWLALAPRFHTQADRLERLATLNVPTHVIVGEDDIVMRDDCERMAATIPGAGLTVIPGARHSPHAETPDAWSEALTGFLDGVSPTVRPPTGG